MKVLDLGLGRFKFFSATTSAGIKALQAFAAPFPPCRFCPTGGITRHTVPDWLAVDAIHCVGCGWLVPAGEAGLDAIRDRARAASRLVTDNPAKT